MSKMEKIELELWKEIASTMMSPSHNRWHIDLVIKYIDQLQKYYEADTETLKVAAILHDLGRMNRSLHGKDSIEESIKYAREILININFPSNKIDTVLKIIAEHDNTEVKPSTLEGKILKEADFLAGFGPIGIIRIAMWAAETNRGINQVYQRLQNGMAERLESLEFPLSKNIAIKDLQFTNFFLRYLEAGEKQRLELRKGKYIILEGISGSGKDTVGDQIKARLDQLGHKNIKVREPSHYYDSIRDILKYNNINFIDNLSLRSSILIADRYKLIHDEVLPALNRDNCVISVRSFISYLIYQCYDEITGKYSELDIAGMTLLHQFVPIPDLIILLDLNPETAFERIVKREKPRSQFESLELLQVHRNKYLSVVTSGNFSINFAIVDANKTVDEVADQTWDVIQKYL